ncbi:LPO_1073/Vpar_1526 family protein [Nocardia sp. A7]|uniref:LPO_1073/Vpar_1526 family protein n=1 Tax=Nocardia sp. A7 TaxID=2789274 RepID=UPI00397B5445
MKDQDQLAGANSQQYQAGGSIEVHNHGMTAAEVADLAMTIFRQNFIRFGEEAMQIAVSRAEELVDSYLRRMQSEAPAHISSAADPSMQRAIYTAQAEYASRGDSDLGSLLVEVLVERSQEKANTMRAIALAEAIGASSKLTSIHYKLLAVVVMLRYTTFFQWRDQAAFRKGLQKHLLALFPINDTYLHRRRYPSPLPLTQMDLQHMEYVGVGRTGGTDFDVLERYPKIYPGIFSHDFTLDELDPILHSEIDRPPFIRTEGDPEKLRLAAVTHSDLDNLKRPQRRIRENIHLLHDLLDQNKFQRNEVYSFFQMRPLYKDQQMFNYRAFEYLIEIFQKLGVNQFELSSVGIVVGRAVWKQYCDNIPPLQWYIPEPD